MPAYECIMVPNFEGTSCVASCKVQQRHALFQLWLIAHDTCAMQWMRLRALPGTGLLLPRTSRKGVWQSMPNHPLIFTADTWPSVKNQHMNIFGANISASGKSHSCCFEEVFPTPQATFKLQSLHQCASLVVQYDIALSSGNMKHGPHVPLPMQGTLNDC